MSSLKMKFLSPVAALLLCSNIYADEINYSIKSQSLKDAIEVISKKSKTPYIVNGTLLEGKTSKAVQNVIGTKNALNQILQDSGLEAIIEDGAIIIREKRVKNTSKNENDLGEVNILANTKDGSAENGYLVGDISGIGIWGSRSLQDTPYQMTVISKEMIENTGSGIDQVYRMNPVIQLQNTSSTAFTWNSPRIYTRGFNTSGNQIIDGIPFSWAQGVTSEDVERIEVLNGLSGFLYGVGYVGGAVNYVTKRPTDEKLINLILGSTGNQAYYAHIDLSDKIDEEGKFSYRLNAFYQDGETSIENQNIERKLISGALDWKVSDDVLLQFDASHKESRIDKLIPWFRSTQSADILEPEQGYAPDWTFSDSTYDKLGLKSLWHINDSIKLRTGYAYYEQEFDTAMPYVYDNYDGTYRFRYRRTWPSEEKNHGAYLYTDFDFETFGIEHTLTIGGSHTRTKGYGIVGSWESSYLGYYTLDQLNNISKPVYVGSTANQRFISSRAKKTNIMIGDDIRFSENWSALVGFNYAKTKTDNYNVSGNNTSGYDSDDITPSLSLIYKPFEDLTTYATYMESLEDGTTVDDSYANAGKIFDPYVSKQYEVGAKYSINESLLLSSALFRIEKANSYEEDTTPFPTLTQNGSVIHEGLELTLTGKVTDNLTLVGGGTIMDLEIVKGKDWYGISLNGKKPVLTASRLAKMYVEYKIPQIGGLTLTGGAYYTGKSYRDDANTDIMPSYTIYDAGVRYRTKIDKYPTTFLVNMTNLTDKKYWSSSTSFGEPRNIAFSMKMEF